MSAMDEFRARRRFIDHPKAERFDSVTVDTVERWKESELSGDEWRFSYVATFWLHGKPVAKVRGASVQDALLQAAARLRSGQARRRHQLERHPTGCLLPARVSEPVGGAHAPDQGGVRARCQGMVARPGPWLL